MGTKHAILGVLMRGPAHGYKIKKIFAPFVSRDGLNDGRVYPVLTHLEQEKLVRKETVRQQKSPNKNLYHITERGRKEFLKWLTGPEDEVDPVKYDFFTQYGFLMKCNFLEHLSKRERISKLERQIEVAKQKVEEYEQIRDEMRERNLSPYKINIMEFGIETQLLKVRWANAMLKDERKRSRSENGCRTPKASGIPHTIAKRRSHPARGRIESTKQEG